jgi:hypothetical protein
MEPTAPEVKSGDYVDSGLGEPGAPALIPTSQYYERHLKELIPALDYEPFYETSEMAGTPARFMGSALVGEPQSILSRTTAAGISGLTSEAAGRYISSLGYKDYENAARLVASFAGAPIGNLVGKGVKYLAMPETTARDELANAIASDFRTKQSNMTPEQLNEAYQNGLNPMVYDMAGPQTRAVLKKLGLSNPLAEEYMGNINTELSNRTQTASSGFKDYLRNIFGMPVDPVNVANAEAKIGGEQRSALYKFLEGTPEAQSVAKTPALAQLDQSKTMQEVYAQVAKNATDPDSKIVVPKIVKGTSATETTFPHTEQGIVSVPGKPGTPDQITNGNLVFYDEAKQVLDGKINAQMSALKPDMGEVRRLQILKDRLTSALDTAIPGYDSVRDLASETFNAASAPQAGYNFMKNMDIFKSDKLADGLNKYTTDLQRKDFAMGSAAFLQEMLNTKGVDAVADYMNQSNAANRMKLALGNEVFDDIYGRVQSQALMGKTKVLATTAASAPKQLPVGKTALASGLVGFLSAILQGKELTANDTAALYAGLGAGAGMAGSAVINGRQAVVGNEILKLASSGKPEDWRKIGVMARSNKNVPEFLGKFNQAMDGSALNLVRANPAPQYATRPNGFARGGSVIDKKSDQLINETIRNKKLHSDETEHMLSMPDDAIVQALKVAKQVAA